MRIKKESAPKRVYHVTTYAKGSVCRGSGYETFAKALESFRNIAAFSQGKPVRVSLEITWEGTREVRWDPPT